MGESRLILRMGLVISIIAILSRVGAVDKSQFKTSSQVPFCQRHKSIEKGHSPYIVVQESVAFVPGGLTATLLNQDNKLELLLVAKIYKNSVARIYINEKKPLRPRHEVEDVIIGDLIHQEYTVQNQNDVHIMLKYEDKKQLNLKFEPFMLTVLESNEIIVTVNGDGLLKFEHSRNRPGQTVSEGGEGVWSFVSSAASLLGLGEREPAKDLPSDEEDIGGGDGETADENEETDDTINDENDKELWGEQMFKTHKDTNKYGPQSVGIDVSFHNMEHIYGLPEHSDSFLLKTTTGGEPYRLYNLDVFEYALDSRAALYGSVPYIVGMNSRRTVGVLWLNSAETWVDIERSTDMPMFSKLTSFIKNSPDPMRAQAHWMSETGVIDIYVVLGKQPKEAMTAYGKLTGLPSFPPLFALAYHQCRWNYNDEEDVLSVNAGFDDNDIPYDVLWLDIEHTDGKRYFTWDKTKFPNPIEMQNNLSDTGRKMVTIIDPHIKRDSKYKIHKEAQELDLYVKDRDGNVYDGWCWPGSSSYLDFFDPTVRDWWSEKFSLNQYEGTTENLFTWNDMNEPSVFNGPEITMHKDAIHYGGWEHRDVHNMYGFYQQMSTYNGLLKRSNHKERPFVLSRAFFSGSQRYGAVWTGDNEATWEHLKASIPMLLSIGIVGQPFAGADVGGFFGNPDTELLVRWYQAAAFQPFFRAHAHLDTKRREPWLFGDDTTKLIRDAIKTRYSLLPYIYTEFYKSSFSGAPVMRPLWYEFPDDKQCRDIEDQFMLGPAILVAPVLEAGMSSRTIRLPGYKKGMFYDMDDYTKYDSPMSIGVRTPLTKVPVFLRGGYIISKKERIRRASSLTADDPYTVIVALSKTGIASGEVFIDDGHSYDYKRSKSLYRFFTFNRDSFRARTYVSDIEDATKFRQAVNDSAYDEPRVDWDDFIPDSNIQYGDGSGTHSGLKTKSWLERVIIVGYKNQPKTVMMTLFSKDSSQNIEETINLDFTYNRHKQVIVIRKPGVSMNRNFNIDIEV